MPTIHVHFSRLAILTRKVGQTDWLVFGVRSGFICRSVHARLQVSACSGYDLCLVFEPKIRFDPKLDFCILKTWPWMWTVMKSRRQIGPGQVQVTLCKGRQKRYETTKFKGASRLLNWRARKFHFACAQSRPIDWKSVEVADLKFAVPYTQLMCAVYQIKSNLLNNKGLKATYRLLKQSLK